MSYTVRNDENDTEGVTVSIASSHRQAALFALSELDPSHFQTGRVLVTDEAGRSEEFDALDVYEFGLMPWPEVEQLQPDELLRMFPDYINSLEGIRYQTFKASETICRNVARLLRRALEELEMSTAEAYDAAVIIEQLETIAKSGESLGKSPTEEPYGVPFPS